MNGGHKLIINKILGFGNTTRIFEVSSVNNLNNKDKKMALRIPFGKGKMNYYNIRIKANYYEFINMFLNGSKELIKKNIRIPKIYFYRRNEFIVLEVIPHKYNLEEYFIKIDSITKNNPKESKEAELALYKFVKTTLAFSHIGDFNPEQLLYDYIKKEWVLSDFTKTHSLFNNSLKRNPEIDHIFYRTTSTWFKTHKKNKKISKIFTKINKIVAKESGVNFYLYRCKNLFKKIIK